MVQSLRVFSAFTVVLLTDVLVVEVHANGSKSPDEPEIKYAVIGAGIGAFLALCFVVIKLYMIKKHMLDNDLSDYDSGKRPSLRNE
nr:PREDICTED: putative uncharacterized protein C10orf128 homolog [Lepisosteus oculatus]